MMQQRLALVAGLALLISLSTLHAGGWVVVDVRDLPERAAAGDPIPLVFTVRGAGVSPVGGLTPSIVAKSGTSTIDAVAAQTKNEGEYAATLILPRAGNWTIRITVWPEPADRWNGVTLPELSVHVPGTRVPPPMTPFALGQRMFVSRGCATCHRTGPVETGPQLANGPNLFAMPFTAAYLKGFLRESHDEMHSLSLTASEVRALATFITGDRSK